MSKNKNAVLVIYTGGTLGMVYDKRKAGLVPFKFSQILAKVPELQHLSCALTITSLSDLIDSSNMKPSIWIQIAQKIIDNYAHYDGFVVLHGTDTMAYTASAISFLLQGLTKPVIFTGAQLPVGAIRNDARRNLVTSIEIASAKENNLPIVPEVCIFFNDVLLRGNRARKVESSQFDAFQSFNYPPLAKVGINVNYDTQNILAAPPIFRPTLPLQLNENVGVLKLYPGISQKIIESILDTDNLQGIIIETYGSGNAPTDKWFLEILEKALKKNIIIYNVSQCLGGKVQQGRYATGIKLKEMGLIGASDMTTEAAITKMMYLLAQNLPEIELKKQLSLSLCGEMTE
ncbi:MAG: asparaginase [Cytophagia bacterium]|nr:MAG: asparaginase [Cytophagia bacterium]TAG42579.1 MAG: asparaginase [Cytophagia bacterium]